MVFRESHINTAESAHAPVSMYCEFPSTDGCISDLWLVSCVLLPQERVEVVVSYEEGGERKREGCGG